MKESCSGGGRMEWRPSTARRCWSPPPLLAVLSPPQLVDLSTICRSLSDSGPVMSGLPLSSRSVVSATTAAAAMSDAVTGAQWELGYGSLILPVFSICSATGRRSWQKKPHGGMSGEAQQPLPPLAEGAARRTSDKATPG